MALQSFYFIPPAQVDGIEVTFIFSILKPVEETRAYLRESHIIVYELIANVWTVTTQTYTLNDSSITFDTAPTSGDQFKVQRETPRDELFATFERGVNFTKDEVKDTFLGLLYSNQEIIDQDLPTLNEAVRTGTWQVELETSDSGQTHSANNRGIWMRKGNIMTVPFHATITAKGAGVGTLRLINLPFAIKTLVGYEVGLPFTGENFLIIHPMQSVYAESGNIYLTLYSQMNPKIVMASTTLDDTTSVTGTLTYETDTDSLLFGATED